MRAVRFFLAMGLGLAPVARAEFRPPAELKAALGAIIPAGKVMRLAYIKDSTGGYREFANQVAFASIYVASGWDGVTRRLTTAKGRFYNVNLTADGKRVLYYDGAANRLVVVNWSDGSLVRQVNLGSGHKFFEYWRDPKNGSDWALIRNSPNLVTRMNIDNPTEVITVYGGTRIQVAGDGVGLSDDGKKMLCRDSSSNPFGLWDLTTSTWAAGPQGCQMSMRAGPSYQYNVNPSGHKTFNVRNADGTLLAAYPGAETVRNALTEAQIGDCVLFYRPHPIQEATRFTQHADFATFFVNGSKVNPILVKLPGMEFTYIEQNLVCNFVGDMDAVVLESEPGVGISDRPGRLAAKHRAVEGAKRYTITGRHAGPRDGGKVPASLGARGVVVVHGPRRGTTVAVDDL